MTSEDVEQDLPHSSDRSKQCQDPTRDGYNGLYNLLNAGNVDLVDSTLDRDTVRRSVRALALVRNGKWLRSTNSMIPWRIDGPRVVSSGYFRSAIAAVEI